MALHKDLPIYKVTYDLVALVTKLTANMSRDFKRSLGDDLRRECLKLSILVYRANFARSKLPHLSELLERLQVVELTLRLSHDLRLIAPRQYAGAIELTDKIGRQATGWRKSLSSASPAD
ncbi:four helix bundle protein [Chromobacterium haemolyticum]|uniref:four helix bundle protein n=1 Tax=Chromobacterium haemolyticum TaxID=394935 RepID=UPI00193BC10E